MLAGTRNRWARKLADPAWILALTEAGKAVLFAPRKRSSLKNFLRRVVSRKLRRKRYFGHFFSKMWLQHAPPTLQTQSSRDPSQRYRGPSQLVQRRSSVYMQRMKRKYLGEDYVDASFSAGNASWQPPYRLPPSVFAFL